MKIAVVGATGMLGQHVARQALRAGHGLIALYRNPRLLDSLADLRCEARQADLEDVDSLRSASTIPATAQEASSSRWRIVRFRVTWLESGTSSMRGMRDAGLFGSVRMGALVSVTLFAART
ncbi:MAG TPA: NAD(P)H-binding protein [Candidatus Saccharimonadales bacterium]|nr:NAD(P)H-binding protein [Candidatus Saccharimonadales bacterium]